MPTAEIRVEEVADAGAHVVQLARRHTRAHGSVRIVGEIRANGDVELKLSRRDELPDRDAGDELVDGPQVEPGVGVDGQSLLAVGEAVAAPQKWLAASRH